MARNDGIDRTVARNQDLETPADVAKVQEHNEREKDSYSNQDIVPERTSLNVHFKAPTDDYVKMFEQMEQDGVISTRGLKPDAVKYGELVFDVNSAYFYNHGGYEFAKQFYADAYKAAAEIVGGEQYILSAVMHADERNRAMSEALGEDVYHYHLHVVYIPVVEKQILWSKRCKDEALRGTVKEVITQVSRSKKWESKPVLGEDGNPMLNAKGKKILKSSYSVLQDDFFQFHAKRRIYRCGAWRTWKHRGTSDCDPVQGAGRTAAAGSCDRAGGTGRTEFGGCQSCHSKTEKETGIFAKGNQGGKDHCADSAGH